jgi:hypothetical protein
MINLPWEVAEVSRSSERNVSDWAKATCAGTASGCDVYIWDSATKKKHRLKKMNKIWILNYV